MKALLSFKSALNTNHLRKKISSQEKTIQDERKLIAHLTEKQIDKIIEDSFPASDPPSTY